MKKVLITGGSSGIGKAFAEKYASLGYVVTIVARDEAGLKETISVLPKVAHAEHSYIVCDLSTDTGIVHLSDHIAFTEYHTLINNAGVGAGFGFAEIPLEKLLAMIRLNCDAVLALSQAFLKKAHEGSVLMNIGSVVSHFPYPGLAAYAATKSFVLSLGESLHVIYKPKGVHVLTVCPGPTDTNFFIAAGDKGTVKKSDLGSKEKVVEQALYALKKGKIYVVTGRKNKVIAFLGRHLPIKLTLWLALKW